MNSILRKITNFIINQKLLIILIILLIVLSIRDSNFLTIKSLISIVDQITINGIMAAGMTILLISGMFDLSVGAVMAFTGIIIILLQPFGLFISILGGLIAGTSIGALNGLLVVKGKINAFIATMGTLIIFRGLGLGITNNNPIKGTLDSFQVIGQGSVAGIPYRMMILIVIYVIVWYVLKFTRFGRFDYAIGGNTYYAKLAGINVDLYAFLYFVSCSFFAAVSGVILCSSVNSASGFYGLGIEIWIIAAVVIGGTSLAGGRGGVIGSIQGILILGIIERAMIIFNIDTNYQSLFRGSIIILVVVADAITYKRRKMML